MRRKTKETSADVFDVFEAAWFIGAHVETIRRLARKKKIPAYKVGKDWRFSKQALIAWRSAQHKPITPPLILVVDDEQSIRETVGLALRGAGYRVETAADGKEAIDLVHEELPKVAILDLAMPGLSGVDVLREIRTLDPEVPVIILTGYPDGTLMHQALKYSPLLMMAKPVKTKDLLHTVKQTLNMKSAVVRAIGQEAST